MYRKLLSWAFIILLTSTLSSTSMIHAKYSPTSENTPPISINPKIEASVPSLTSASNIQKPLAIASQSVKTIQQNSFTDVTVPVVKKTFASVTGVTYDTYNTTPDQAVLISTSDQVQGYITTEDESRWYYTQTNIPGKLTASLFPGATAPTDYDLYVYKLDQSTGTLNYVAHSAYGAGHYEQLSAITTPGYYFVRVHSYHGSDTSTPFTLVTTLSDTYDGNEPDDNPLAAKDKGSVTFSSKQTIDNLFDEDWTKIKVTGNTGVRLNLTNTSSYGEYRLDLYDANLNSLGYLNQIQQPKFL